MPKRMFHQIKWGGGVDRYVQITAHGDKPIDHRALSVGFKLPRLPCYFRNTPKADWRIDSRWDRVELTQAARLLETVTLRPDLEVTEEQQSLLDGCRSLQNDVAAALREIPSQGDVNALTDALYSVVNDAGSKHFQLGRKLPYRSYVSQDTLTLLELRRGLAWFVKHQRSILTFPPSILEYQHDEDDPSMMPYVQDSRLDTHPRCKVAAFRQWRFGHLERQIDKKAEKSFRMDKTHHLESLCNDATDSMTHGRLKDFFDTLNRIAPKPRSQPGLLKDTDGTPCYSKLSEMNVRSKYLCEIFFGEHTGYTLPPQDPSTVTPMPLQGRMPSWIRSIAAWEAALGTLRLNKNCPPWSLPAEILRILRFQLAPRFSQITEQIGTEGRWPWRWSTGRVFHLLKPKLEASERQSYRTVMSIDHAAKAHTGILLHPTTAAFDSHTLHFEYGFKRGRSPADASIHLSEVSTRLRRSKFSHVQFYGDLWKAFTSVNRDSMSTAINTAIPDPHLRHCLHLRHNSVHYTQFDEKECLSSSIAPTRGVVEGDALGPICFRGTYNSFIRDVRETRYHDRRLSAQVGTDAFGCRGVSAAWS